MTAPSIIDRPSSRLQPERPARAVDEAPLCKSSLLLFTLAFGWCGGHRYYLKRYTTAVLASVFFWTGVPAAAALIELVVFAAQGEGALRRRYPVVASARATVATLAMSLFAAVIVLGVLAAVTLPRYQQDVFRGRVASALQATRPLRHAVLRYRESHDAWPDRLEDLGPVMVAANPYIASITLRGDGRIRVSFTDGAGRLGGETLDLVPQRLNSSTYTGLAPAAAGATYGFVCRGGSVQAGDYPPACRDILRRAMVSKR